MLVSVIVVSRNAKDTIRRCLDSIFSQTYKDIEIVVVDSSDDETTDIIEEYRSRSPFPFKLIRQPPLGVGVARNTGIENSSGEIILFVDSDVWIDENYVEKVVECFSSSDKVLSVSTDIKQVAKDSVFSRLVRYYEDVVHHPDASKHSINPFPARKELFKLIGGFRPELKVGEDTELKRRLISMKDELEEKGYEFARIHGTAMHEEKVGTDFRTHFGRCRWYGKALANREYFLRDPKANAAKILLGVYCISIFPLLLWAMPDPVLMLAVVLPLLFSSSGVALYSIKIGKFKPVALLLPLFIVYRYTGILIGMLEELIKSNVAR